MIIQNLSFHTQPLAEVNKTFGANGELIIKLRAEAPEDIDTKEPVFICIDGLPVPFYFKSFEPRGNNRVQVIFEDMENQKLAEELVGKTLLIRSSKKSPETAANHDLIGYMVADKQQGELGAVVGFLDIPGNPCLLIDNNGREVLIPFHDAIVKKADTKKRQLQVDLPEGLLEL